MIDNLQLVTTNLLDSYSKDPTVRDRLNAKGLYVSFQDNTVLVNYYLTDIIDSSTEYIEFIEILSVLAPEDTVFVYLDNGGGYLSGAQIILAALRTTQAYTVAIVLDMAASAATIVALGCDEVQMNPHAWFMLHSVSFGASSAKLHENQAFMEFNIEHSKRFLKSCYKDFLTPLEIEELIAGRDFYFTDNEVMERFSRVQQSRQKAIEEAQEEAIKQQIEYLQGRLSELEGQLPKLPEPPKVKTKRKPKVS